MYGTHMVMHSSTYTEDVSSALEFQKHLSHVAHKHGFIGQGQNKIGK